VIEGVSVREASRGDVLPAADFFLLVRRVVGFAVRAPIVEPLSVAVAQISANPEFSQSRLLKRILVALVHGGDFRRAEVAGLDAPTSRLVIALVDLRVAATVSHETWLAAVISTTAALGE